MFRQSLVDVELNATTALALLPFRDATEVFDDPVIIRGEGAEGGEDFLEGGGFEDVVGGGVGVVEDGDDDVAELFVRSGLRPRSECRGIRGRHRVSGMPGR